MWRSFFFEDDDYSAESEEAFAYAMIDKSLGDCIRKDVVNKIVNFLLTYNQFILFSVVTTAELFQDILRNKYFPHNVLPMFSAGTKNEFIFG